MPKRKGFSITEAGVAVHLWKRTGNTYTCRFRIEGVRKSRNTCEGSKDRAKARVRFRVTPPDLSEALLPREQREERKEDFSLKLSRRPLRLAAVVWCRCYAALT